MAGLVASKNARRGNPLRMAAWSAAALLLLLPLVAMQFTPEVDWDLTDFTVFGTMLLIACGTYELAAWMSDNTMYRAAFGMAIATGFFLTWVTLAVGIIGSEHGPANLMYGGVLAVAIIGAIVARLRPEGMARALLATAIAQALVLVIARIAGSGYTLESTLATGFFGALWLASAWLFRQAAQQDDRPAGATP